MRSGKLKFILLIMALVAASCWDATTDPENRASNDSRSNASDPKVSNSRANNGNSDSVNQMKITSKKTGFMANLPSDFSAPSDDAGKTLFKEYGSVFVAQGGVIPPKTVVFKNSAEVASFQATLQKASESIGGFQLELQSAAMRALKESIDDAKAQNLSINPRDKDSAKRTYDETIELWASRVDPALKHWAAQGKITQADADRIKSLSPYEQVPEVFKLEARGVWFAKDLSKSIIYSVAPPGTSQHLSMLAFDVKEHENEKVRAILAKHGWFQTVTSDLPHFTYLGAEENQLSTLGLKRVSEGGRSFWVPDI
jgi:D-alanyl-D-alanine carboxypeptidase